MMLTKNKTVSAWRYLAILPLCLALAIVSMNPAKVIAQTSTNEEILTMAEKMPEFPGDLMKYLSEHIKYPKEAKENKIEGKVVMQFVINKDGKVSDIDALKSPHPQFTDEAIRVIKSMPDWKPAMQDGEAVALRMTLPIVFRLK